MHWSLELKLELRWWWGEGDGGERRIARVVDRRLERDRSSVKSKTTAINVQLSSVDCMRECCRAEEQVRVKDGEGEGCVERSVGIM
jgi:hypothetical protein